MLLLIDIFSINKGRGYENPSLEIIVTERCSTGGCPLKEACEHCFLNQVLLQLLFSYYFCAIVDDYAGYITVILPFLAFYFCFAYLLDLVSSTLEVGQHHTMNPIMEGILSCSLASSRGHPPIEL
jgi:hypothetical protein